MNVILRLAWALAFALTAVGVHAADSKAPAPAKGSKVGEVFEEQKIHDVTVWGEARVRTDVQSLRELLIETPTGGHVLLGDVAAWWGSGVLSLGSLIGFATVLGIAARNGILLVSHYRHLEMEEREAFGPALILRGAEERLTPILMTAGCAALALLPLVLKGNLPGQEIEFPMALVILGGLITSTLLNLLLIPALYGVVMAGPRITQSAGRTVPGSEPL